MNRQAVYLYVTSACDTLRHSRNFAEDYVRLKTEFFHLFQWITNQQGKTEYLVFSTRYGADFFEEIRNHIERDKGILPDPESGILGEWDKNFNLWLKSFDKILTI